MDRTKRILPLLCCLLKCILPVQCCFNLSYCLSFLLCLKSVPERLFHTLFHCLSNFLF